MSRTYLRTVLHLLGLSRSAAIVLLIYILISLGLQQALPTGENMLYTPFGLGVWPVLLGLFFIMNAIAQEARRPRIGLHQRAWWRSLAAITLTAMLFFSFCLSFGYMKSLIPVFQPFYLDPFLQRLDIALHGGVAPLTRFQPWLTPALTTLLNEVYLVSWVSVISAYFLWQVMRPPGLARTQFISCFYLLWILGGLAAATLAASVGPVYYSLFYHDAYSSMNAAFSAHMYSAQASADTSGVNARQLLIALQANGHITNLNGMSAMPSMHVGTVLLIALHSYVYVRWLSLLTIPFALVIALGSVALGWHYALDSYAAALLVLGFWWLTRADLRAAKAPPSS